MPDHEAFFDQTQLALRSVGFDDPAVLDACLRMHQEAAQVLATVAAYMAPVPAPTKLGHSKQQVIGSAVARRMSYNTVQVERNYEKMPVDAWTPHDLRRTSRTVLASLGCPDPVAEAILGHMQPGIKGIYNIHGYDQKRRERLTRVAAKYESL